MPSDEVDVTVHTFAEKPAPAYVECEFRSPRGLSEHEAYAGSGASAEGVNSSTGQVA